MRIYICNLFLFLYVSILEDHRKAMIIRRLKSGILFGTVLLTVQCASVPITGRKQLILMPESEMVQMSLTSYDDFLKENKLSTNVANTRRVKEVGSRIAAAVEAYMKSRGLEAQIEGYRWEFNLVQSPEINAWCMPGGKVVVYEGILPVCQDNNGLAVVMGHEIAHAIARHGNERMSQQMVLQAGSAVAAYALKDKPGTTQALLGAAIGLGSNYGVVLPFSRKHELEADRLGLIFMTMAGYDPQQAIPFWTRMAAVGSGQKPPEFMSTHPSDAHRIAQIKALLPEVMKYKK